MKSGFSLVELSIVLVILGLLTGGILAGQSLIRAAELRSVGSDIARYQTAFFSFRDKYFALPGDMTNAVRFWGAQTGSAGDGPDSDCMNLLTAATGTATCNGNGNGHIGIEGGEVYESYRAWQQLANAGLIEGGYSGVTAASTGNEWGLALGVNSPRGRISNTGFTVRWYQAADASSPLYFPGPYGNMMWFGSAGTYYTSGNELKPEEAWNLDTKLDDGRPAYGKILVGENQTTCHTNSDPALANYNLVLSGKACAPMILLGI